MGLHDRDYYRDEKQSGWALDGAPATKLILIVTAIVFVLQIMIVREGTPADFGLPDDLEKFEGIRLPAVSVLQSWGELDVKRTIWGGQIWRLLTHAFLHSRMGIFHIVVNMALLFWFGRELERIYGTKEFATFYFVSAVIAGLTYVALEFVMKTDRSAIGASGAVAAVMMLFTMHYPRHIIYVFFVIPMEMRWAMLFFTLYDLHPILLKFSGDQVFTGVAHAAHLGGLAFGFLYYRFNWRLSSFLPGVPSIRPRQGPRPAGSPRQIESDELDRLLDKIAQNGLDSLTAVEKAKLREASERIKRSRQY